MNELFTKTKLDVYYYIDLENQDIKALEKCLRVYLDVHQNENYTIDKFINCDFIEDIKTESCQQSEGNDVIKRGLITFNKMTKELKLKTTNETWFIYISSGNINKIYENVFVILLNKTPMVKSCYYIINKSKIDVKERDDKIYKLENLKLFNKSLQELFVTDKVITYTNLQDI
jgi:hypothetical protein